MVLCLTCMSSVVAIIGGPITNHLGWRDMFVILLPFTVVGGIAICLFVPETQFRRDRSDLGHHPDIMDEIALQVEHSKEFVPEHQELEKGNALEPTLTSASTNSTTRRSYLQSLAIYTGTYSDTSLFKLVFVPFVTILNPAVIWVSQLRSRRLFNFRS